MHKLLEQQIQQWLDGRGEDVNPDLLAAVDAAYRRADEVQAELRSEIQQARELEAVGRIAGGIAHDFNNLLTVIKGYCDLCLRLADSDEGPVTKGLEQISGATERAAEMTVHLLSLSRRRKPEPMELDLNRVIRELQPMLRRLTDDDAPLAVEAEAPASSVFVDRGRLHQLLLNLVIHANEGSSGEIRLTTAQWDEKTPPAEAFQRPPGIETHVLLAVETPNGGGEPRTAGLAVLQGLADEMGGEVVVSEGEILRLTVALPLTGHETDGAADDSEPLEGALSNGDVSGGDLSLARILVVEDEKPVRLMLEALLTDQGHRVTLSPDPHAALEHFKRHRDHIDLLVTDIVMPGMHGPEMAEIMKKERPDLAVLFISGYDPAARERRGAPAPGGAFLQKPFDAATLSSKIREVLSTL